MVQELGGKLCYQNKITADILWGLVCVLLHALCLCYLRLHNRPVRLLLSHFEAEETKAQRGEATQPVVASGKRQSQGSDVPHLTPKHTPVHF